MVVFSSDNYSDVWPIFFELFFRFWPDCPFDIYLFAGTKSYDDPRVISLPSGSGNDTPWSDRMLNCLQRVESQYVMVFLEDFLLTHKVNHPDVMRWIAWCADKDAAMLRFRPFPGPDQPIDRNVGAISAGMLHRVALQVAVWEKSALATLLGHHESPWQFEHTGSVRSARYSGFYSLTDAAWKQAPIAYIQGIEKGIWNRGAVRFLGDQNIPIDLAYRKALTVRQTIWWYFLSLKGRLLSCFPLRNQPQILSIVRWVYRHLGVKNGY